MKLKFNTLMYHKSKKYTFKNLHEFYSFFFLLNTQSGIVAYSKMSKNEEKCSTSRSKYLND